jgi:integrase
MTTLLPMTTKKRVTYCLSRKKLLRPPNTVGSVREADLRDDLTIHSARHGYAALLYYKTKDLRAVQKQLDHSSLNMTSLYTDIMQEENEEIANKILDD